MRCFGPLIFECGAWYFQDQIVGNAIFFSNCIPFETMSKSRNFKHARMALGLGRQSYFLLPGVLQTFVIRSIAPHMVNSYWHSIPISTSYSRVPPKMHWKKSTRQGYFVVYFVRQIHHIPSKAAISACVGPPNSSRGGRIYKKHAKTETSQACGRKNR